MNLLLNSQSASPLNAEENDDFQNCAAQGAAVGRNQDPIDSDLAFIIDQWTELPEAVRTGITAIVRASGPS